MLDQLVSYISQPPVPTPSDTPDAVPTPMIYIAILLFVARILAWKYKAIPEFIIIVCSTVGGFIVGFIATPPYGNVGLGMMVAIVGLLFSTAIVMLVRTVLKTKRT